ncbi:cytochrome P450 81Q32-like [Rutidosis leptorrhynchoides]|uniref:cytochrome P450 81Q32-like n=1 Tax=Rutidosis leptorrhynchoides TaxID=125765 RepID=UPI003A99F573
MIEAYFSHLILLLLIFIIPLIVFMKLLNKTGTKSNLPPSPPSFPIIGHLLMLKQPLHENLQKLSQKFGPVMLLHFGVRKFVVVTSLSVVEECFNQTNDVVFSNRPRVSAAKNMTYNFSSITVAPYGDLWRALRRVAASEFFSTTHLAATTHSREHEVKLMCRQIYNESQKSQQVVELESKFRGLMNNIITMGFIGKRYFGGDLMIEKGDVEVAHRFQEIMEESFTQINAPKIEEFLPFLKWVGIGRTREMESYELMEKTNELLDEFIRERRRKGCSGSGLMVDSLLALQDAEPELYTHDIIRSHILAIILTGTEAPNFALEWTMSLLLNNRKVMQKLKNEIDTKVDSNRLLQEGDLDRLSYLQNVIDESLRLYPPVPMLLPREASKDIMIGGYSIPRGTTLMVNAWAIHRDPVLWDNPDEFIPERFGEKLEDKYKTIPFGVGRRGCPGMNLGYRVLGLALGTLIQAFEWETIGGGEIDMTASYGDLLMCKLKPLQALCKPRSNMIAHFL